MLSPGDPAPSFALPDQSGEEVSLSSLRGRKVVLFFYPRANTPGCTEQACGLRDVSGDVDDVVIIGISPDTPAAQKKFDDRNTLGFPLLSDVDHEVAVAYGVWGEKKMYGKTSMGIVRSAFVINEEGVVEEAWYKISPKDTPAKMLASLGQ